MDTSDTQLFPEFITGKNGSYSLPPVSNRTAKAVSVKMKYTITDEKGASCTLAWSKKLAPFKSISPVLNGDIPLRGEVTVRMDILVDGKAIVPHSKKIVLPKLFRVTGPRYRNYMPRNNSQPMSAGVEVRPYDEKFSELTCRLRIAGLDGTNDAAFVETPVSNCYFRVPLTVKGDRQALHFKGPVILEGTLFRKGKIIAEDKMQLFVMPARRNAVTVRDDLVFMADEKPFFPLGIYHLHPTNYAEVAALGFNMVQTFNYLGMEPMIQAEKNNLKVLMEMHPQHNEMTCRNGLIGTYMDHPNLGFWYVVDEPGLDMTKADGRYKAILEDIKHPAFLVSCLAPLFKLHQRACDILSLGNYLISRKGELMFPLDRIAACMDLAVKGVNGDKPIIFILQGFGNEPENWLVNTAYQAVIHGASGLFWYAWKERDGLGAQYFPKTQKIMKRVCGEMKTLEPLFFNRKTYVMRVQNGIHTLYGVGTDRKNYLLLCNPSDKEITSEIDVCRDRRSPHKIGGLFGAADVEKKNGKINVKIEPYGVRAYRW